MYNDTTPDAQHATDVDVCALKHELVSSMVLSGSSEKCVPVESRSHDEAAQACLPTAYEPPHDGMSPSTAATSSACALPSDVVTAADAATSRAAAAVTEQKQQPQRHAHDDVAGRKHAENVHLRCDLCNVNVVGKNMDDDEVMQAHITREHRELYAYLCLDAQQQPVPRRRSLAHDAAAATQDALADTSPSTTPDARECDDGLADKSGGGGGGGDDAACAHKQHEDHDASAGAGGGYISNAAIDATTERALGKFVLKCTRDADGGPKLFAVIQRAQDQLNELLSTTMTTRPLVYLFGSCVSLGIWDGRGDADFSAIVERIYGRARTHATTTTTTTRVGTAAAAAAAAREVSYTGAMDKGGDAREHGHDSKDGDVGVHGGGGSDTRTATVSTLASLASAVASHVAVGDGTVLPRPLECQIILDMASKLRSVGFRFEELEPVTNARTPVLRRARAAKRPHVLQHDGEPYCVEVYATNAAEFTRFREKEQARAGRQYVGKYVKGDGGVHEVDLVEFARASDALHFFRRRDGLTVLKRWLPYSRLPEIFSVDFDLSCRTLGVRNSWFLRAYFAQQAVFRVGSILLKQWSKQWGVNYPRQGYLTSYAVNILWIYYLLRIGAARYVDPHSIPVLPTHAQMTVPHMPLWGAQTSVMDKNEQPEHAPDTPVGGEDNSVDDSEGAVLQLGQLLHGFFAFYASFDWDGEVVTLRHDCSPHSSRDNDDENKEQTGDGGRVKLTRPSDLGWNVDDTASRKLKERTHYRICIEDIYENNLNLGRHLSPCKAAWVKMQFAYAASQCVHHSRFHMLLDDRHAHAEAVMRVELHRYLLFCPLGRATVAQVRTALRKRAAALLATYELRKQLSSLWQDASDDESVAGSGKGAGHARTNGNNAQAKHDQHMQQPAAAWRVVCLSEDHVSNGDDRVLQLLPVGIKLPEAAAAAAAAQAAATATAVVPAAATAEAAVAAEAAATAAEARETVAEHDAARSHMCAALEDYGIKYKQIASCLQRSGNAAGYVLDAENQLLRPMFYCVDDVRAFYTYHAREMFAQHLRQVALALEEQNAIDAMSACVDQQVLASGGGSKAPVVEGAAARVGDVAGSEAVDSAAAQQAAWRATLTMVVMQKTVAGRTLHEPLVSVIINDVNYVVYNTSTMKLERTWLLHDHAGHIAVEEEVERLARSYAPPRVRRDTGKSRLGVCDDCHGKNVLLFPTTMPAKDSGWYCNKCWRRFDKSHY